MRRSWLTGRTFVPAKAYLIVVGGAIALQSGSAAAFCRTSTCGSEKSSGCAEASKCESGGAPLYWPTGEMSIDVENGSMLRSLSPETGRDVLTASVGAWTSVDCGGGRHPSISVSPIQVRPADGMAGGAERDARSNAVNEFRFIDESWPHDPSAIALTTVRYGVESGRIVAADIEANSAGYSLTVVDMGGDFDLQSVLTHEAGHFFGLAHVPDSAPTMFGGYNGRGNIEPRTLEPDDQLGICTVYPPNRFDADPSASSGCSCRTSGRAPASAAYLFATAAALAWCRRRRRPA